MGSGRDPTQEQIGAMTQRASIPHVYGQSDLGFGRLDFFLTLSGVRDLESSRDFLARNR